MPGADGQAVLREVRKRSPDTRVIVVSVQDDESAIQELLALGATAYLTKPFTVDNVKEVLKKLENRGD